MKEYEPVIGLEVHVQLATDSKMFCRCPNRYGAEPNTLICPVCTAQPGALPVLNRNGLRLGLRIAVALGCMIERENIFERKNYFYPDLPKGYQISQLMRPLGTNGLVDIGYKKVRVNRGHMEEDAGKSIHQADSSLVDLNRCGVPLMEIVTEPDLFSAQEAYDYLTVLKQIVQYAGASSCDMEKGFLRCDANVSIREKGTSVLGTKTELKNLNSFKAVKEAIEFEIKRQKKVVIDGGVIVQETRLWDDEKRKTLPMRSKEEAHDYRYFPEPDLVLYTISDEEIAAARAATGELPADKKRRFEADYALSDKDAQGVVAERSLADFFEAAVAVYRNPKKICNWLLGPVRELMNEKGASIDDLRLGPDALARLVALAEEGVVNNLTGKDVLREMADSGDNPDAIISRKGLTQVSSSDELITLVDETMSEHPAVVEEIRNGKQSALMFLVGQVMRKTKGRANPKRLQELFTERI